MPTDWSLLEDPEVRQVAEKAVRVVSPSLEVEPALTGDDLLQEAHYFIATKCSDRSWVDVATKDPYGVLLQRVVRGLYSFLKTPLSRSRRVGTMSDALQDELEHDGPPALVRTEQSSLYDRQLVELLLPAVWDVTYAWGMEQPHAADHDMPKSKSDPKKSNTLWAHLADIRMAWREAPITFKQRRALLMRFGLDWEQKAIAAYEGVTKQAIGERIEAGVGKIVAHLNGERCASVELLTGDVQ